MERHPPRQANERGNKPGVPVRVYAIDKQQAPESPKAIEGKNFEDDIFLKGRECEDPKISLNFLLFLKN